MFWLATAKTGAVMVPTNPVSSPEEMAYILAHSEARLAVTESRVGDARHAVRDRCPALLGVVECRPLEPLLAGLPDTPPDVAVTSSDKVSIQYTSGTTSKPSPVRSRSHKPKCWPSRSGARATSAIGPSWTTRPVAST